MTTQNTTSTEDVELKMKKSTDIERLLYGTYTIRELLTGFETINKQAALDIVEQELSRARAEERTRIREKVDKLIKKPDMSYMEYKGESAKYSVHEEELLETYREALWDVLKALEEQKEET